MNKFLKKINILVCLIAFIQISMNAQNEVDALRFSELDWQGTARFMGAGRAFGAVGAEFSALNVNPAAIGLYKKSEVTFSPVTISIYKNMSTYNGNPVPAQAIKYNLNSAGIVLAVPGVSSTLWKKIQIGFGYNRIKNFNNTFSIEGRGSTIGYEYAHAAEGLDYRDIDNVKIWSDEMYYAYEYWLISPKEGSFSSYYPTMKGLDILQSSSVTQTGGIDEMIFSLGTNYDDKLFLGATIGVPFINFTENRTYMDTNDNREYENYHFIKFKMNEKLSVRSTGINLKLGIIYQPVDFLRVGVAFHTPTYYGNVKDIFDRELHFEKWEYVDTLFHKGTSSYNLIDGGNEFKYSLTTPLRVMANVAFFIAQRAFISAEYEFADYSMANMFSVDYNFTEKNKAIKNKYGACHIARIGAELNVSQVFAIRVGYNYISSPYKNEINDGSKHYASAGFGFRTNHFYSDFAYAFTISKEKYWMYDPLFVNEVNNQFITHRIMLTMGVRF
ncbi:MAG: hypothetical protein FWH59_04025 [Lentimicrobiaceae bacterium]|nr:hypothetical protein [Lentimicrobiaceae bacterium]